MTEKGWLEELMDNPEAQKELARLHLNESLWEIVNYCDDTNSCPECGTFGDQPAGIERKHQDDCLLGPVIWFWLATNPEESVVDKKD